MKTTSFEKMAELQIRLYYVKNKGFAYETTLSASKFNGGSCAQLTAKDSIDNCSKSPNQISQKFK